jgi:hypothetical protein
MNTSRKTRVIKAVLVPGESVKPTLHQRQNSDMHCCWDFACLMDGVAEEKRAISSLGQSALPIQVQFWFYQMILFDC